MSDVFGRFLSYLQETKKLNRKYYEREETHSSVAEAHEKRENIEDGKDNKERIAILLNSRMYRESLPKEIWLKNSQAIEEKMLCYCYLPYQICNCSYIGNGVAWTGYNLNNKRILQIAINQINYLLEDTKSLDETACQTLPHDYRINFNSICFDGPYSYGLPRSYILYCPETPNKKRPQYPLIAFFNTAKGDEMCNGEFYMGELYYAINGDLSKAVIHCHKHRKFAEYNFSVVGCTFLISKIRTNGQDGKLFTLYDCAWKFTDYIDFA